jgi:hypothetical protein
MASYGVFLAACGYEYHGPKGYLAFAPRIRPDNFRAAFTAAEGWGTFRQTRNGPTMTATVDVKWGRLKLRTLRLNLQGKRQPDQCRGTLSGNPIAIVVGPMNMQESTIDLEFSGELTIRAGDELKVELN